MTPFIGPRIIFVLLLTISGLGFAPAPHKADAQSVTSAPQWQEVELTFNAARETANPYTEVDAWVDFVHDDGTKIRRPIFWDGARVFRVRFASPKPSGTWRWTASDRNGDAGIQGKAGTLQAEANKAAAPTIFTAHGFWKIPPGGRNLIHADGTARLLCADTAWALPWRATPEQAEIYARDRSAKGFNAALLMTIQPDMKATGRVRAQKTWGSMSALKTFRKARCDN
ncbi:MAG: DUF5060 domain-containing protein [Acidobacteriota bacterium]